MGALAAPALTECLPVRRVEWGTNAACAHNVAAQLQRTGVCARQLKIVPPLSGGLGEWQTLSIRRNLAG